MIDRRSLLGVPTNRSAQWAAPRPAINPREAWATDRPPRGPLEPEDVRFLVVHHSASRNGHSTDDAPRILRAFYDFHTGPERGWNDIAYNFLIDFDGVIWEGRQGSLEGPVAGDATGGNQGFTQLVCVIGDYNAAQPSERSLDSLVMLLAWLASRYSVATAPGSEVTFTSRGSNRWPEGVSVTTPTITGHRTMSLTTCPGALLNAYVTGGLMADVDSGSRSPTTTAPPTSSSTTTTTRAQAPTTQPGGTSTTQSRASTTLPTDPGTTTRSTDATTTSQEPLPPPASDGPRSEQGALEAVSGRVGAEARRSRIGGPGSLVVAGVATAVFGFAYWRARRMRT